MANQHKSYLKQVQKRFARVISRRKSAARELDFSDNFLLSKVQTEEKTFAL